MSQICTLFKNEFDKAAKELNVAPVIVNTIYELVLKDLNPTLSDNIKLPTKQQFIDSISKYYNFNAITFEEEQSTGYKERTIKNASADATIALATDFNSAGERLTKRSVYEQGKKYIPIDANNLKITPERVNKIVDTLNSLNKKESVEKMCDQNYKLVKEKYEEVYQEKLTYSCEKGK